MSSNARKAFDKNAEDVNRLLEIHQNLGGDTQGRRFRLEVLNKSAIILITAFWEAYCEDIASEALDHIIENVSAASALPRELKKKIAKEIKTEQNEIAVWDLADDGWKTRVKNRPAALTEERNRKLNTPKSANMDELFSDAIGLSAVSNAWRWKRMSTQRAKQKLDDYVSLRGAIAHRGAAASSCTKRHVEDYFSHVKELAAKTGGSINTFVKGVTGKSLWRDGKTRHPPIR